MMKVTATEYRVVRVRKFLTIYLIAVGSIAAVYFAASTLFEYYDKSSLVGYSLLLMFKLVLAIWVCTYAFRIIEARQSPPPGTWVIENWRVYKGRKAYLMGWFLMCCGMFLGVIVVFAGYLLWNSGALYD